MKKAILSVVILAGMLVATNIEKVHAIQEQLSVTMTLNDDDFVDVELKDLSEVVQAAINAFTEEYDIKALKYNAEKQLTKVKLIKKDDQSVKKIYLDAEGKEVEKPACEEKEAVQQEEVEIPMSL